MKKRALIGVILLASFISLAFCLTSVSAFSGVGSGTQASPYNITNCTQLQEMNISLSSIYQLVNDIECNDTINWNFNSTVGAYMGFIPVGIPPSSFTGNLYGRGYNITNLYINRSGFDYVGLIGNAGSTTVIDRLGLINFTAFGRGGVGVVGNANALNINYSFVERGFILGSSTSVAGLVGSDGSASGRINNSYFTGSVSGAAGFTGGLAGQYAGTIENSYFNGSISSSLTSLDRMGGIAGYLTGTMRRCHSHGNVTAGANSAQNIGGLVGLLLGTVTSSYSDARVIGYQYAGGLVGATGAGAIINNSYAKGFINGTSAIGGLVGYVQGGGLIQNSYSTGNVSSVSGNYAGGLIGAQDGALNTTNCFAVGNVSIGFLSGNIAGALTSAAGTISNTFFLNVTPKKCAGLNENGDVSACRVIRNTPDFFYSQCNNPLSSWDFSSGTIWGNRTGDFPCLMWEPGCLAASACTFNVCGNGIIEGTEGCDDGNTGSGDGCSSSCARELGSCDGTPAMNDSDADTYYEVTSCCQLQAIRDKGLLKKYELGNNVECNETRYWNSSIGGFDPVAPGADGSGRDIFRGNLFGRGYNISNLYINRSSTSYVGIFAYTRFNVFDGLTLVNFSVTGTSGYVGAICGASDGTTPIINNSYVSGTISGGSAGGFAGSYVGSIYNSVSAARVSAGSSGSAGGLIGLGGRLIYNCSSSGSISTGSFGAAGGLIGLQNTGTFGIDRSYSTANVTATGSSSTAGGLVGQANLQFINNSYATGNIISLIGYPGGVVGLLDFGAIQNSYATGDIFGGAATGGFVAYMRGSGGSHSISNCYSTGKVNGTAYVGGFAGVVQPTGGVTGTILNSYSIGNVSCLSGSINCGGFAGALDIRGTINNSFSTGNVSVPAGYGAFIGRVLSAAAVFNNNYWNNVSGGTPAYCWSNTTGNFSTGCTAVQNNSDYFKGDIHASRGPTAYWDFVNIWAEDILRNRTNGYPWLRWGLLSGSINASKIIPLGNISVYKWQTFEFSSNVTCSSSDAGCGNVSAWLEPAVLEGRHRNVNSYYLIMGIICIALFIFFLNCCPDNRKLAYAILLGLLIIAVYFVGIRVVSSAAGTLVSTTVGATPFFTTSNNSQNCGVMFNGNVCVNNWTINASGAQNYYEFYVIYNSSDAAIQEKNTTSIYVFLNEPPYVTINNPFAISYTNRTVDVNISLSEDGYCEYSLNDGIINYTLSNFNNDSFTGITNVLTNENYSLKAYCNDTTGLTNYTETVNFTMDHHPGTVILKPTITTYESGGVIIDFGLNEEGYCEYSLDGGATKRTLAANASNTGFSGALSGLGNGVYTIKAYCNDTSGGRNDTERVSFMISLPEIPLASGGGCAKGYRVENKKCVRISVEAPTFTLKEEAPKNITSLKEAILQVFEAAGKKANFSWIILILAVLVLLLIIIFLRRKKSKKKRK